ncbi:DUF3487 family protein [Shewanella glacialipiscicola]|uniref:DUF3487 family protein n=1 Tax=Shewanella glacialipiscicola TaxID=614069 RepID=UPI003D7B5AA1
MNSKEDFIPDRLNGEPPIFMGLSMTELSGLAIKNFMIGGVIFIPLSIFLGQSFLFSVIGFILTGLYAFLATRFMATKQRERSKGKPDGYFGHNVRVNIEKFITKHPYSRVKCSLFISSGKWE